MGKCPCKWCNSYKHCLWIPRWMCLQIYLKRLIYMRKPASEKTNAWKKKKQSYQTQCLLHLEERHKYCLPHGTEKCVMNVAIVKPSLFLQLKQTESVISWLLLPNPKSQEDYMWFESSSLYLFFTGIFQLFQTISVFTCTKPLQSNRKHLMMSWHATFGLLKGGFLLCL